MEFLAASPQVFTKSSDLNAVLGHAQRAAEIAVAGQADARSRGAQLKSPSQLVTDADRAAEEALRAGLMRDFPGENIVGEEFGGTPSADFWTLDPIDGTANYVSGLPLWGVAVGRVRGGQPDLGVIILPALNLVMATWASELYLNGAPFKRRDCPVPSVSMSPGLSPPLADVEDLARVFRAAGYAIYAWRCSAAALLYTAMGALSGHMDGRTKVWDAVPGAALCLSAGLDVRWGYFAGRLWIKVGDREVHKTAKAVWETAEGQSAWI